MGFSRWFIYHPQPLAAYRSQGYNETQVRWEFLEPFFEALGWNVASHVGYTGPYKEVIRGRLAAARRTISTMIMGKETNQIATICAALDKGHGSRDLIPSRP